MQELARSYPNIKLVKNKGEFGFANTLKAGFRNAESDLIVPAMADLCDDPKTIEIMFKKNL